MIQNTNKLVHGWLGLVHSSLSALCQGADTQQVHTGNLTYCSCGTGREHCLWFFPCSKHHTWLPRLASYRLSVWIIEGHWVELLGSDEVRVSDTEQRVHRGERKAGAYDVQDRGFKTLTEFHQINKVLKRQNIAVWSQVSFSLFSQLTLKVNLRIKTEEWDNAGLEFYYLAPLKK